MAHHAKRLLDKNKAISGLSRGYAQRIPFAKEVIDSMELQGNQVLVIVAKKRLEENKSSG
jgi:hypothetical protein